jgi:hypothetical protein
VNDLDAYVNRLADTEHPDTNRPTSAWMAFADVLTDRGHPRAGTLRRWVGAWPFIESPSGNQLAGGLAGTIRLDDCDASRLGTIAMFRTALRSEYRGSVACGNRPADLMHGLARAELNIVMGRWCRPTRWGGGASLRQWVRTFGDPSRRTYMDNAISSWLSVCAPDLAITGAEVAPLLDAVASSRVFLALLGLRYRRARLAASTIGIGTHTPQKGVTT